MAPDYEYEPEPLFSSEPVTGGVEDDFDDAHDFTPSSNNFDEGY